MNLTGGCPSSSGPNPQHRPDPRRIPCHPPEPNPEAGGPAHIPEHPCRPAILPHGDVRPTIGIVVRNGQPTALTINSYATLLPGHGHEAALAITTQPIGTSCIVPGGLQLHAEEVLGEDQILLPVAAKIRHRHPDIQTQVGDCQEPLHFPTGSFDRILAIHVLEHLPNLPAAWSDEIHEQRNRF